MPALLHAPHGQAHGRRLVRKDWRRLRSERRQPRMMRAPLDTVLIGLTCEHVDMVECHPGCGHFSCPTCGLTWDEYAEGAFEGAPEIATDSTD